MRKRLDPVTVERISNASMTLGALPIFIDDTPSMLPSDIRAKIHLWRDRGRDPRVVFVDHLQIVATPPGRKSGTRNEDVSEITKGLKVLAKELGITIVLLSQMNRCIEKRSRENGKAPRPLLSDLRDSGSIEQDADVVLFIYRPKRPEEEPGARVDPHTMQDASLILAKQRNGPTGDIPLVYKPAFCVFFNGTRC
jgi:replicative DNA helicase